jgi:cyclopropane-fatty-acyl-phospholipid synthase
LETKLSRMLERGVRTGAIVVVFPSGASRRFGDGSLCKLRIRFTDAEALRRAYGDPELQFPELYMQGKLLIEEGDIFDLLLLAKINKSKNFITAPAAARTLLRRLDRRLQRRILPDASKRNVAHHYDLNEQLFRLFLDSDLQYSCAYFETGDETLEEAQRKKKRHIAAKMLLGEGQRILDIGCGWGGMALYLARTTGAHVTGVTLSEEQHRVASRRAEQAGLSDRVQFRLMDYRKVEGTFDRIVSVGMFEHVGLRHYQEFFATAKRLMAPDGVFLLHSIVRVKPNRYSAPFVDKYIFPQGHIPSLSEALAPVEKNGLLVKDVEILTYHYADTLAEWRRRFRANRDRAVALYDEAFFRLWDMYLCSAEINFRHGRLCNFQIQITRRQQEGPRSRTYIAEAEARLAARE